MRHLFKWFIWIRILTYGFLILLIAEPCFATDNTSGTQKDITEQVPLSNSNVQTSRMNEIVVFGKLDQARDSIAPSLGATQYDIGNDDIDVQSQGENASFNQVILRAPSVAEDSFGQVHVRGEHANLQYRINDVLIPEGITGFGQELDTRFADKVSLITGALPAQFGYRTAGIIDIHTKNGAFNKGGEVSAYGGAYDTLNPGFEYGGSDGKLNYYFSSSYLHNAIGIEDPANRYYPIHDDTNQYKAFGFLSYLIDDTSRISLISSFSYSTFQIPDNPSQPTAFALAGVNSFDSSNLNENQTEQNYYGVLAYQKAWGDLNVQVAAFTRYSGVLFTPDQQGDLMFNGIATTVNQQVYTNGLELDSSYALNDKHTLRGGAFFSISNPSTVNTSSLFTADAFGNQIGTTPFTIIDHFAQLATLYGFYLQDEWKIFEQLTINFGARFDQYDQYVNENQISPRVNVIYKPFEKTSLHAGYARYFTPPPEESVESTNPLEYNNTTNASQVTTNSPVRSERSHYFDVGITQEILPGLSTGLDAYYKIAQNQIDMGQFGAAVIFSPFNYNQGIVDGIELSTSYKKYGFDAYNNVAVSRAMGRGINSGQFQFPQDELNYINNNWVHLDHDQTVTISQGVSYTFNDTKVYTDMLYGSGLRRGFANTSAERAYYPINMGIEQAFRISRVGSFKARFDVVNILDEAYQLRDGSGIGVGAPQYGQRRGFYGGISYKI